MFRFLSIVLTGAGEMMFLIGFSSLLAWTEFAKSQLLAGCLVMRGTGQEVLTMLENGSTTSSSSGYNPIWKLMWGIKILSKLRKQLGYHSP